MASARPSTLGELRAAVDGGRVKRRPVRDEVRENLIARLRAGQPLFPGIIGYDDTVVPQIVNAVLSRHNFILLGLRGQAKSRILRALTGLLDDEIAVVPGCEIHDDPLAPLCAACRARIKTEGDALPIRWLSRDERYVEKLATPDVTIADMIGDIDPIKAARSGLDLADELTMHYGLVPRANRGIFAINELPDLAGKIQVGLFNILQEGDVQIKGYPIRLPLDVLMVFSANPEDYTARGKIITPLKDRIGSEIRTHYPATRSAAMAITAQEAWLAARRRRVIPEFVREAIEEVAFQARADSEDRQAIRRQPAAADLAHRERRLERRAARAAGRRDDRSCRASPISTRRCRPSPASSSWSTKASCAAPTTWRATSSAAPSATSSPGTYANADLRQVTEWFDLGGNLQVDDTLAADELISRARDVQGLRELAFESGIDRKAPPPVVASAIDFVLEGLYAQKKISRSEEFQYQSAEPPRRPSPRGVQTEPSFEREIPNLGGKKKYYN